MKVRPKQGNVLCKSFLSRDLETQSYVLNFHGRVTQASVKNFQVVHDDDRKSPFAFKTRR